ncbi:DUF6404 family protein [Xenorhabdus hominickii]
MFYLTILLWKFGVKVLPPTFARFWCVVCITSLYIEEK